MPRVRLLAAVPEGPPGALVRVPAHRARDLLAQRLAEPAPADRERTVERAVRVRRA